MATHSKSFICMIYIIAYFIAKKAELDLIQFKQLTHSILYSGQHENNANKKANLIRLAYGFYVGFPYRLRYLLNGF